MRFLTLVSGSPSNGMPPASMFAEVERWAQEMEAKKALIARGGLMANSKSFHVEGGALTVRDGPFTESKEVIGGFSIVEYASRDEALRETRKSAEMQMKLWPEGQTTVTVYELFDPDPA